MTVAERVSARRPVRLFLVVWAFLSVATALWSIATPIGGSPDEPAHLVKAASVVRGELLGEPSTTGNIVHVPQYVAWAHAETCYAFQNDVTAGCADPMPTEPGTIVESRTTAGLYNPMYYAAVGWPSLIAQDSWGIFAMRIVSGVLTMAFLAAAITLVSTWRRPTLPLLAIGVVTTPMLLFLGAAVNPNALEITTTIAVFAGMLTILRAPQTTPAPAVVALVAVAGAIAMNARGLSPLWLAVAVLVPLLLVPRRELGAVFRRRSTWVIVGVLGAGLVAALAWTVATNSLAAAVTDPEAQNLYPGVGTPAIYGFLSILERTIPFAGQLVGIFGWMDTNAPITTLFVWAVLAGGLVLVAFCVLRGRALVMTLVLAATFVLLPPIVQGAYVTAGGFIWQGRYAFPLFACLLIGAATLLVDRVMVGSAVRRGILIAGAAVAFAHAYTFASVLKRYVSGESSTWIEFALHGEWAPPLGALPLVGVYLIVVAVGSVLALRALRRVAGQDADEVEQDADYGARGERQHNAV